MKRFIYHDSFSISAWGFFKHGYRFFKYSSRFGGSYYRGLFQQKKGGFNKADN